MLRVRAAPFAAANCPKYPKASGCREAEAKAKIEADGLQDRQVQVDGNCYEIYGDNKEGKKAEVYFDAEDARTVVKAEIGK